MSTRPAIARAALAALSLLGACSSTHELDLHYSPPLSKPVPRAGPVHLVAVNDARDEAVAPKPATLGRMAHGTELRAEEDDRSLAHGLDKAFKKELSALGFKPVSSERVVQLAVSVVDWEIEDDGQDARFRCALDIAVLEPLGKLRERSRVEYEAQVFGSLSQGSWQALDRAQPEIFAEVVQRCLRKNPVVLAALTR